MHRESWKRWIHFQRFWGGRIWNLSFRHHQFELDFRMCAFSDMAFGNVTKQDRQAVDEAVKQNTNSQSPDVGGSTARDCSGSE